jgi:hypothetical protein
MTKHIETHLVESRFFKPAKSFSHSAHISSFEECEELYWKSIEQPEKFWAQQAAELPARPRLRPARGIRQFDSAERDAARFSGLARILERQNHREANAYAPE